jgi:hypothetical protein
VPELIKSNLATSRASQPAEHAVDARLSPAAIAVHVLVSTAGRLVFILRVPNGKPHVLGIGLPEQRTRGPVFLGNNALGTST